LPLSNNGGPTFTHSLSGESPALDMGANPRSLATDQRGASYARIVGGQADIGAFELQTVIGPVLPGDYNGNDVVDAADYVLWRKTLGTEVAQFSGADGNGNSSIDPGDYGVWRTNFGNYNTPSTASDDSAHETYPAADFAPGSVFSATSRQANSDTQSGGNLAADFSVSATARLTDLNPTLRERLLAATASEFKSGDLTLDLSRTATRIRRDVDGPLPGDLDEVWDDWSEWQFL